MKDCNVGVRPRDRRRHERKEPRVNVRKAGVIGDPEPVRVDFALLIETMPRIFLSGGEKLVRPIDGLVINIYMADYLLDAVVNTDVGDEDVLADVGIKMVERLRTRLQEMPDDINNALVVLLAVQQQTRALQARRLNMAMKTETREQLETRMNSMTDSPYVESRRSHIRALEKKIASMPVDDSSDQGTTKKRPRTDEAEESTLRVRVNFDGLIDSVIPPL